MRVRRGFTMIEVLMATAITGMVLFVIASFMFTISLYWLDEKRDRYVDEHMAGVAYTLTQLFAEAEFAAEGYGQQRVEWSHPPGMNTMEPQLLGFNLSEAPPLFVSEGAALPRIKVWLHWHRDEGLGLLWYSTMEAQRFQQEPDVDNINWTPLSPWVRGLRYHYYDEEDDRWETSDESLPSEENSRELRHPQFIELQFVFEEGEEPEGRLVALPSDMKQALLY
ncbi:MAG: prepilin-type N-terminal cleavage/methylation domain-containing protein [Verrucomicrobiota bacterium]